jgi:hypothetical protein
MPPWSLGDATRHSPDLKRAYRQAVELIHPDLALSDRERQGRTKLMASLNLAYERGDLREIERPRDPLRPS